MTDRQLLEAYTARNNIRAFGEFVTRHEDKLLSYAVAVLRDESLAQDVVQETFYRVARRPQKILSIDASNTGERNWLMKVVRNLCVDAIRRKDAERRAVTALTDVKPKAETDAAQQMEVSEQKQLMRRAIDRLPTKYRELVVLKVREQKSYKEIAEITGTTVTNVGFQLHRAIKMLGKEMRK